MQKRERIISNPKTNVKMATRQEYKLGIDVISPAPSGTGGDLIQDNFKTIADLIEGQNTAIADKASASHTHSTSNITGLDTALNGKAAASHTHSISNITGLDTALSGKAPASHSHSYNDLSDKPTIPAAYTLPTASTSELGGVKVDGSTITINNNGVISASGSGSGSVTVDTSLSDSSTNPVQNKVITTALNAKASTSHMHSTSDISGLDTALSNKAASNHTHTTSDIANFPTLATVATSGSYNDLKNKPTIPAAYTLPTASTSQLGGVKVDGSTITISNGVISASGSGSGSSTLMGLSDVKLTNPSSGQILKYNGSKWVNGSPSSGGSDGTQLYGSPQALITKAYVGPSSDIINNDNRGYLSVDLQAERTDSSNYAKGDYSFLHGRNSGISAQDGYAFGSGTDFDVVGAIQTNQNKAGSHGWQGHTGVLGLSFAPSGSLDAEIFALDTGAIALFDVDVIAVSNGLLTLYKLALSVYQGSLAFSYNWFTPICQWTPYFYLSNNKLYLTGGNSDVVQVGIRYTILGSAESNGASSSGGAA